MMSSSGGAGASGAGAAGSMSSIGVAKMVVMGAIMYSARSWNNEDAKLVHQLRVAYAAIHILCVGVVLYVYYVASQLSAATAAASASETTASAASKNNNSGSASNKSQKKATIDDDPQIIYVPAPPQPFADPSATTKKSYTRILYSTHVLNTARSLIGSTFFSIAMTCGLHWYKGMVTGLAIQTVLAPLTAWDNALVRAVVKSWFTSASSAPSSDKTRHPFLAPEYRLFDEKVSLDELDAATDQVVDEQGNPVKIPAKNGNSRLAAAAAATTNNATTSALATTDNEVATTDNAAPPSSFEDVVLDTWDDGANADLSRLMCVVTKQNVNTPTADAGWTPLMIVCGLHSIPASAKISSTAAIVMLITDYGANVKAVDIDGWNCFHWAMFHGHRAAIAQLILSLKNDAAILTECCCTMLDKENKSALDIARQEGHDDMVQMIEAALGTSSSKTAMNGGDNASSSSILPSVPNLDASVEPKKDQ